MFYLDDYRKLPLASACLLKLHSIIFACLCFESFTLFICGIFMLTSICPYPIFAVKFMCICFSLGKNYERVCETCYITLNKCAIFDDNGAISPGGVRIGKLKSFLVFVVNQL